MGDHTQPPSSTAQIKEWAYAALLAASYSAMLTFLPALAGCLVALLLNLLFHQNLDWKLGLAVSACLTAIWFFGVFVAAFVDLKAGNVRDSVQFPSFPGRSFYRGLFGFLIIGSFIMMIGLYRQHESVWQHLIPLALLVLTWFGWPRTIHFYPEALGQKTRFGKMRLLQYAAVEQISYDKADSSTIVAGPGIKIVHTTCHADKRRFHDFVQQRTGKLVYPKTAKCFCFWVK